MNICAGHRFTLPKSDLRKTLCYVYVTSCCLLACYLLFLLLLNFVDQKVFSFFLKAFFFGKSFISKVDSLREELHNRMTFFLKLSSKLKFESCNYIEILSLCHFEIPASENSPEPSKDGEPDNDPAEFRKIAFSYW